MGYDRPPHFISPGAWDEAPLKAALLEQADAMVGGDEAWLLVKDTASPKNGACWVAGAPPYASALGKNARRWHR